MDEFPEFERRVIESLRQPLEDKVVTVSRAKATFSFPAQIIMVLAMNPCPCGNFGSDKECRCPQSSIEKYQRKISGPILDRIDLCLDVYGIDHKKLEDDLPENMPKENSKAIRKRVGGQEKSNKIDSPISKFSQTRKCPYEKSKNSARWTKNQKTSFSKPRKK